MRAGVTVMVIGDVLTGFIVGLDRVVADYIGSAFDHDVSGSFPQDIARLRRLYGV